jgi:hypothetical protein
MISDPIVEEVRARRQEHAARCNHDLKKIATDVRKTREQLNWPIAKPKRKRAPSFTESGHFGKFPHR